MLEFLHVYFNISHYGRIWNSDRSIEYGFLGTTKTFPSDFQWKLSSNLHLYVIWWRIKQATQSMIWWWVRTFRMLTLHKIFPLSNIVEETLTFSYNADLLKIYCQIGFEEFNNSNRFLYFVHINIQVDLHWMMTPVSS